MPTTHTHKRSILVPVLISICIGTTLLAQSGTRSYQPRLTESQQRLLQEQELAARRRLAAEQSRLETEVTQQALIQLATPEGTRHNRRFSKLAFAEARQQFIDLKRMVLSLTEGAKPLSQPFRLSNRELDRQSNMLRLPEALQHNLHEETVAKLESQFTDPQSVEGEELLPLLNELSVQLAVRAKSSSISAREYALAKRFVTGLRHEITLNSPRS